MPINRSSIVDFLVDQGQTYYGDGFKQVDTGFESLFEVVRSDKHEEVYYELVELGLHKEKQELQQVTEDTVATRFPYRVVNKGYANYINVSHEFMADNRFPEIFRRIKNMGTSAARTYAILAMTLFNLAESVTQLGGDGKPFVATDHPLYDGSTVSNRGTPASLSEDSLTADFSQIARFKNARGLEIDTQPTMLLVPVELENDAMKLLKSTVEVGGTNATINVFGRQVGRFPKGMFVSTYLSDPKRYFLLTDTPGLIIQNREEPRLMEDYEITVMANKIVSYFRKGIGCYDWRSFFSNPGA